MEKVVCLGKNYPLHAEEMKEGIPEVPAIFCKPPSSCLYFKSGELLEAPWEEGWSDVHHELEIVFELKVDVYQLPPFSSAMTADEEKGEMEKYFSGVTLGLDMTKRSLQAEMKKKGWPWEVGKIFPGSSLVGTMMPLSFFFENRQLPFTLTLEGFLKQTGHVMEMSHLPLQGMQRISTFFPLKKGDLFFTGTPHGVGPVQKNQQARLNWGPLTHEVCWKQK